MRNLNDVTIYIKKLALGGSIEEVGGKGYRLAELYKAGFNVPEGFVLTTKAFEEFLNINHLYNINLPPKGIKSLFSTHLIGILHDFYKQIFGSGIVIIRSSATAEDLPNISFAGVYKSVLDVTENLLEEAIRDIYMSVFSEQAIKYIKQNSLFLQGVKMAIIMQRQIEPMFSGVCFTANPVSGDKEYIVEFTHGRNTA